MLIDWPTRNNFGGKIEDTLGYVNLDTCTQEVQLTAKAYSKLQLKVYHPQKVKGTRMKFIKLYQSM